MSARTVNTRDTLTGKIQRVTVDQYEVFKTRLQVVGDDAKPYAPGMFKPGLVGEFDNPEPPTDAEIEAQTVVEEVAAEHAPNSKVAREARAALKEAEQEAEAARLAAEAEAEAQGQADAEAAVAVAASTEGKAK